jgi:hypothetical protein
MQTSAFAHLGLPEVATELISALGAGNAVHRAAEPGKGSSSASWQSG